MNKPVRLCLELPLTKEQVAQLDQVAAARLETTAEVAARAIADYLARLEAYRAYVAEGEADFEAGRFSDWEQVKANLEIEFGPFED